MNFARILESALVAGNSARQWRGASESGHIVMGNGRQRVTIPRHNPINAITMGAIAKDAGLTPEQFRDLL